MISEHILNITFLNQPDMIFFLTIKWFHLISNNSVSRKYFGFCLHSVKCKTFLFQAIQFSMSTILNCSKYYYVSPTIQLNISH